jgi:hypothetical protein
VHLLRWHLRLWWERKCREAATQLSITWRTRPALALTRAGLGILVRIATAPISTATTNALQMSVLLNEQMSKDSRNHGLLKPSINFTLGD